MHGGSVINGLHMRAGSVVIELVNAGFERATSWVDQNRGLLQPTMHFRRVLLSRTTARRARGGSASVADAWNADANVSVPELLDAIVDSTRSATQSARRHAGASSTPPKH